MAMPGARMEAGARCIASPAVPGAAWPHVPGYRIERLLGRGRRSTVYLARDLARGREVALKLAHLAQLENDGDPTRFAREFKLCREFVHPNVVGVFDHGVSGGLAYLAMEYAPGGHLGACLGQAVAAEPALALLRQAASALGRLHRGGFVHRDVKPANFLLGRGGGLLLADFGLACRQGTTGPRTGTCVVGTPRYASPEQSEGAPAYACADVYSLGVVLYELMSGQAAFPGQTLTELLCQHVMAPVPQLPHESGRLQPLLDSMLAKSSAARLADAAAVLEWLEAPAALLPCRAAGGSTQDRCVP
jgi:serine/threonine-protein kinase PpkA